MAEDSQAEYAKVPSGKKRRWATPAQKILFLLVGLNMLGLVVERWSIYNLQEKLEGVTAISPDGFNESGEISTVQPSLDRTEQIQPRPFAHLVGAYMPEQGNNRYEVQWMHSGGEAVLSNMGYNNGRLLVQKTGYYYIYSKVTVNAAEECSLILHKVLKVTLAYDRPIELMKSSLHCPKDGASARDNEENLWNSFLAGIFQLQSGDQIFVTLENSQIRPGYAENFMGAFMISTLEV